MLDGTYPCSRRQLKHLRKCCAQPRRGYPLPVVKLHLDEFGCKSAITGLMVWKYIELASWIYFGLRMFINFKHNENTLSVPARPRQAMYLSSLCTGHPTDRRACEPTPVTTSTTTTTRAAATKWRCSLYSSSSVPPETAPRIFAPMRFSTEGVGLLDRTHPEE